MQPTLLQVPGWELHPWLAHGFTTRSGGVTSVYGRPGELNLGLTREDDPAAVQHNRALLLARTGMQQLALLSQVHGAQVLPVTTGGRAGSADALVTATPGLLLGAMAADCVPVLIADTRLRAVAAVHAGWRGTAAAIVQHAVQALTRQFASRPQDLIAAVGPSIGPCCYNVGEELRAHFDPDLFTGSHLNLWEANRRQLLQAGVPQVSVLAQCTACADSGTRFFSHRRDHGRTGRAMGVIGIRP